MDSQCISGQKKNLYHVKDFPKLPLVRLCSQSCILQLEFTKPERGGLGFSLVGGVNGSSLQIKDICCGGVAEQDGRLRVGDILLEVIKEFIQFSTRLVT